MRKGARLRATAAMAGPASVLLAALLAAAGCGAEGGEGPPASGGAAPPADGGRDWFSDRTAAAGLDFVHFNGMTGEFHQPEGIGSGVGLLDYDNDGDLDVYLVQGGMLDAGTPLFPAPPGPLADRLFRNDLDAAADPPRLRFTDVTAESGIGAAGYGMGVAAGDIDNDGRVDLYVTAFGANQLFRNDGDGTFTDISRASGTDDPAWSVPASFLDFDRDGWLDLFVGNYLHYAIGTHRPCLSRSGARDYCSPQMSRAEPDRLYRNRGDGTFEDVTAAAGLGREFGPALGSATADFDGDGWIDIFVANDLQENQLWINQRDGTFMNMAPLWGAAVGADGDPKSDMGVDAGDFDDDGDDDLFITELTGEGNTLYVNDGGGRFEDQGLRRGIRVPSLPFTGFGAAWIDFDNDGWLDLAAVNGRVVLDHEALGPDNPFPLQQRNLLQRNLGNGRFEDATARGGAAFTRAEVSRGAAFGDLDNDGDTDMVVSNAAGPARLLVNDLGNRRGWVGLRLVGGRAPRDMLGARVAVTTPDGTTRRRRARADGSYASANDPRVLVGLGDSPGPVHVRVVWPDGGVDEWNDVPVGRYTTLTPGGGR